MLGLKLPTDPRWVNIERRDEYVFELNNFIRKGFTKNIVLVDKLLFSALVEARSCERFKVLSDNINDPDLKQFYRDLMVSEANHYTLFLGFAKKYADGVDVDQRWKEYLDYEAEIISKYGKRETIHG